MTKPAVLGFTFGPDEATAGEVFRRAHAALQNCSVWRTCSPDQQTWFVLVVDQSGEAEQFDWAPGRPYEVPADVARRLMRRRVRATLESAAEQQEARYEGGALITEAGILDPLERATCDFCSQDTELPGTKTILCDSFAVDFGAGAAQHYLGSWLACAACAPIVLRRDVAALVAHVVERQGPFPTPAHERASRVMWEVIYEGLYACMRGARDTLDLRATCQHPPDEVGPWGPGGTPMCRVCGKQNPGT